MVEAEKGVSAATRGAACAGGGEGGGAERCGECGEELHGGS